MPTYESSKWLRSGTRPRLGRVLVVDDDSWAASAVAQALDSEHIVTVVAGASDALARIARGERYDVVLCAAVLPIVSGIELHRRLGVLAPAEAACIVFMTTPSLPPDACAYLARIPNARLEKPVDLDALQNLIHTRLNLEGKPPSRQEWPR